MYTSSKNEWNKAPAKTVGWNFVRTHGYEINYDLFAIRARITFFREMRIIRYAIT